MPLPPPGAFVREGRDEHGSEPVLLRAGPVTLEYLDGTLRYISHGPHEAVRRVLGAVRDRNWGTVPAKVTMRDQHVGPSSFRLIFDADHVQDEINFAWRGTVTGDAHGVVEFVFDGEARSTFLRNRIGLVVLHPRECAGLLCRARDASGRRHDTSFPNLVAVDQPLPDLHGLSGLSYSVGDHAWLDMEFSGDEFETEDQRAWIDASFKTFSTPLRLPHPVLVAAGTRVRQSVLLRLQAPASDAPLVSGAQGPGPRRWLTGTDVPLVPVGIGTASHGQPLTPGEAERVALLRPSHLRVDIEPSRTGWQTALARAITDATWLDTRLELVLLLSESVEEEAAAVVNACAGDRDIVGRWLVFGVDEHVTRPGDLRALRHVLASFPGTLGGGTDADLYQLSRWRYGADAPDFVSFSMNPQVHACDTASLSEALTAMPDAVQSAAAWFRGLPIVVSPVTLRPRFNPVATDASDPWPADALPPEVDPRQLSLFGAAWTLGTVIALSRAGAASVTLFETSGWRGVVERAEGAPLPHMFPSVPGGVFPLFHVLADVAEFTGGSVTPLDGTGGPRDARTVTAAIVRQGDRSSLLAANLTASEQQVESGVLSAAVRFRSLAEGTVSMATVDPTAFRSDRRQWHTHSRLVLQPFEYVRFDF